MVKVRIPKGKTLKEVTTILSKNNLVKSDRIFMLAVKGLGFEKDIQAGHLVLHEPKTNLSLVKQLVYGMPQLIKFTVLEGWDNFKVAEMMETQFGIASEKTINLLNDKWFTRSLGFSGNTLEGFLFPDTYYFEENASPKSIIHKMVSEYNNNITKTFRQRMKELALSELQTITLASIIEGEAMYDEERKNISSVYHNRLKKGMKLQADPTIQYIIPDGPRRLLHKDLRIKSPYNTYIHKGLPPGPINNPGLNSIIAALYPSETDYYYFVARGDGYHTFSRTQNEHNIAKRKLNQLRKKLNRQQIIQGQN